MYVYIQQNPSFNSQHQLPSSKKQLKITTHQLNTRGFNVLYDLDVLKAKKQEIKSGNFDKGYEKNEKQDFYYFNIFDFFKCLVIRAT